MPPEGSEAGEIFKREQPMSHARTPSHALRQDAERKSSDGDPASQIRFDQIPLRELSEKSCE